MALLVKFGKYVAINKTDKTTMGNYVIKFFSETYTLQYCTRFEGKISSDGELFVKAQYVSCMIEK